MKALNEFKLREDTRVLGGSKGIRMTFYREQVIKIAQTLQKLSIASPKTLKIETQIENTYSIIQKNYYGLV